MASSGSTSRSIEHLSLVPEESQISSSPLPAIDWADSSKMWEEMRSKDTCKPYPVMELCLRHPRITPAMLTRTIHITMGVCSQYSFHRETFYLSLDIFHRYLDSQMDVDDDRLLAISATCVWIACKLEEEDVLEMECFYYGVCTEEAMIKLEVDIYTALRWRMLPHITAHTWTTMYMQIQSHKLGPPEFAKNSFELPHPAFSTTTFVRAMKILDMSCLDVRSRKFCSSVLAASAFYLTTGRSEALLKMVTGYALASIRKCVAWLEPFSTVINREGEPATIKEIEGVSPDDVHNIQVDDVSFTMFEEATKIRKLTKDTCFLS